MIFFQKLLINRNNCGIIYVCQRGEVVSMLLEFSCSNHKSIKEKVVFSAIAGKDDTHEELLYNFGNFRVLKSAVIYGANGSGKSNLIDAINFTKMLVVNSINHQPGASIRQTPHKLLSLKDNSTYAIQFVTKGIRYAFGFTLNNMLVTEEYLFSFPNGRQVKVFERENEEIIAGDKFRGKFDVCKNVLKPNRLLLSCAANFSDVIEVQNVFAFFRDDLVIYRGFGLDDWMNYSLVTMNEYPKVKNAVMSFLQGLGTGIKDIRIKCQKKQLQFSDLPPFLSDEAKTEIVKTIANEFQAKVVYDSFEVDLMSEESTGVQKLIEFICPYIDIIVKGKVLICDELEANLHEAIVYGLVDLFRQLQINEFAQMFCATHDTSILDLDLFRRDQIWFTEMKRQERATDLYSLAEIKNVRKDENIGKGYISGKYGAIPMLNESLASLISKMQTEGE